jgi:hypothetical protein
MDVADATQQTVALEPVSGAESPGAEPPVGTLSAGAASAEAFAVGGSPAGAPAAGVAPAGAGIEPCPHCGAALALDQRYCLECGAPRTYLSGMLLERLRPTGEQGDPARPPQAAAPGSGGGTAGVLPPASRDSSSMGLPWGRGNVLVLIAGVGVLLLAMGVGVLIGRSGGSSASNPAPQVITVGGAATGSSGATSSTPEETASTPANSTGAAKHKDKGEAKKESPSSSSSGAGSSSSKPASPSVLKNLHGGSGQNYEQKSKNLPNVVSTG